VEFNRPFEGTCHLQFLEPAFCVLHAVFFVGVIFRPEDDGEMFYGNIKLTSTELHGIISQKIKL
jgi:hypothetical protein